MIELRDLVVYVPQTKSLNRHTTAGIKYVLRAGASGPVGPVLAGPIFEANVGVSAASTTIT